MLAAFLRILIGFAAACLGAGLAMVMFVVTPSELMGLAPAARSERISSMLELSLFVASQAALFAAPFALVAAIIGEWRRNRSWLFYALSGVLMAALGFLAQHATEQAGQPTIANQYAFAAFASAGFIGGLLYWLFSGRRAGDVAPAPGPALALVGPAKPAETAAANPAAPGPAAPPSGAAAPAKPAPAEPASSGASPAAADQAKQ